MCPSDVASDNERVLSWVQKNKNGGDSSEVGLASGLYKACLRTLGLLSKQYVASQKLSRERKARLVESHARLCLFGDGLLHDGALEHCFKVDNGLREEVIGLLYRLGKTLLKAESLYHVYDPVRTKEGLVSSLSDLLESASVVLSLQDESGDDVQSDLDNSETEDSEIECEIIALNEDDDVLDALDTYTTSMMDLRPVLEQSLSDISKSAPIRAGILPTEFHVTEAAQPYVLQVHDKFRDAKKALVERLGEANWQRYMRLKAIADTTVVTNPGVAVPEAEVPKSAFRPISQFHDSGLGTSVPSRSQYAASNASHTSFLSTDTDASKGRLRVPSTPMEVGKGEAFTCSICTQKVLGIKNRVDWKIHVFADLNAYICTFVDCGNFLTTYPTRKLWAAHEFDVHRSHQQYECHDCSRTFLTENDFVNHISDNHDAKDLKHTQLLATISAAKRSVVSPLGDQACPLCQKTGWTLQRDFVTHLGRHLEEIALASLPREDDSESESDSCQELDSIEGGNRTSYDYVDKLAIFHKNYGTALNRFPSVDKRPVDLYKLSKAVKVKRLKKSIGEDVDGASGMSDVDLITGGRASSPVVKLESGGGAALNGNANAHVHTPMASMLGGQAESLDDDWEAVNPHPGRGRYKRVKSNKTARRGGEIEGSSLKGYSGKIMSSLSTSLKNSYQRWLFPYEQYVVTVKPGESINDSAIWSSPPPRSGPTAPQMSGPQKVPQQATIQNPSNFSDDDNKNINELAATTSYWSVPEVQKFPDLVAYFGKDFHAIADFMKSKSPTMVKNFYTREINSGKKELEEAAKRAEGMRERGESMVLPTPIVPPKKKSSRILAPPETERDLSRDLARRREEVERQEPGQISATSPLVVRQDVNGVQWITFEYSRNRVKMEYTIRCDVDCVDVNNLNEEFKRENCVYLRAYVPKDQYKGNRLQYETYCNTIGWLLAELNPALRSKRGLIQRAVDAWRNINRDPQLRA